MFDREKHFLPKLLAFTNLTTPIAYDAGGGNVNSPRLGRVPRRRPGSKSNTRSAPQGSIPPGRVCERETGRKEKFFYEPHFEKK